RGLCRLLSWDGIPLSFCNFAKPVRFGSITKTKVTRQKTAAWQFFVPLTRHSTKIKKSVVCTNQASRVMPLAFLGRDTTKLL
ncbi:MAG: hypothetical protein IKD08_06070, partial [Alphaproteobacteria bacterium]|nr:hypothetical protein [Alphaproteobacteria bacterium]